MGCPETECYPVSVCVSVRTLDRKRYSTTDEHLPSVYEKHVSVLKNQFEW